MTINHRPPENVAVPEGILPYHCFDVYMPLTAPPRFDQLIVYVHGGVWRTGDKADAYSAGLLGNLSHAFPTAALCSVNYRLSVGKLNPESDLKHPAHNADVARAIDHALALPTLRDVRQTFLVGHSIGAFICLSLAGILEPPAPDLPRLSGSARATIRGLVLVDGIYDLVELLDEYPGYKHFVVGAFGEKEGGRLLGLDGVSPLSWPAAPVDPETSPRILILHSRQDSLLTTRQSELAATALKSKLSFGDKIECDFDSVSGDHDELLLSTELGSRIKSFIAGRE